MAHKEEENTNTLSSKVLGEKRECSVAQTTSFIGSQRWVMVEAFPKPNLRTTSTRASYNERETSHMNHSLYFYINSIFSSRFLETYGLRNQHEVACNVINFLWLEIYVIWSFKYLQNTFLVICGWIFGALVKFEMEYSLIFYFTREGEESYAF